MRHAPELIGRIAMESAADMIVNAAFSHLAQSEVRHVERALALFRIRIGAVNVMEKIESDRSRKFRRAAEAAEFVVELRGELLIGLRANAVCYLFGAGRLIDGTLQLTQNLVGTGHNLRAICFPRLRDFV